VLQDGRVVCAGSNTHQFYTFTGVFPTELRIDAFSPPYLDASVSPIKPTISVYPLQITYGTPFAVTVSTPSALTTTIELNLVSAPFNTHSFSQGQRVVNLNVGGSVQVAAASVYQITATAPPSPQIAPPGYYMLFAVNQLVPSVAVWIQVSS
jgi:hypothetical protein